jgi:decaprenylphospho-beta-D-erythro-pentofuranosid-2-ulose 2-reductase
MQRVLIVGATSAIAIATARKLASDGASLLLAGRSEERLAALAQDLRVLGANDAQLTIFSADANCNYEAFAERNWASGLDLLLLAHGALPDQRTVQDDPMATREQLEINAISTISLLAAFAGRFEQQGSGTIAVISSVSGDRGRQSNYLYGAAKAAVSVYCQGLRNRLSTAGVQVLTVKPGFVDTPMTAEFEKGLLWAQPEQIASGILKAVARGADVVYLPGYWRYIMLIIKLIPERLFKRLSL